MRSLGSWSRNLSLPGDSRNPLPRQLPIPLEKMSRELITGKDARAREWLIKVVNSRALASFPEKQLPRNY